MRDQQSSQILFDKEWRAGRQLELDGKPDEAKSIFTTLIEEDPERLYVRLRLSAIEEGFGHYNAAKAHAIRAAETVRRGRWKDLAVVARRLLTFDEPALVHDLIKAADWSQPDVVKSSHLLSQYLWLTSHVEESLQLIEVAESRSLPSYALAYSKANALRYLGKMDEATAEYEHCLQLDPAYPYAHWSLAYHQSSASPGSRIPRIAAAQAAFERSAQEQVYLHYALFKEHDDAGNRDEAWLNLERGARIRRSSLTFDSKLEELGFQAMQAAVTAEFVAERPVAGSSGPVPIFVVGMPRSGTTLLERILGNSPEVASAGELLDFRSSLSIVADRFFGLQLTPAYVEALSGIDFDRVGQTYLERVSPKAMGRRFLVDKNPENFIHAGYIARALPQAKILCLRRNPMDACFSNLKELFSSDAYGYSYDLGELAEHYIRFHRLCEHWRSAFPEQFHVVEYESLVTEPESTAKQLMDFCGIAFESGIIDITRNTGPVATASSSQVRQPINSKGIGAWRPYARQLAPLQMKLEQAFGDIA